MAVSPMNTVNHGHKHKDLITFTVDFRPLDIQTPHNTVSYYTNLLSID